MEYRVTVKPSGHTFIVRNGETVVEAAMRCGYFFPHRCRMGVCSTCKGKLLQGQIDYAGVQILGLTQAEQNNGDVLFCCAKPKTDLFIHVDDVERITMSTPIFLPYQVIHHELLSKDISRIELKSQSNRHIHYQAGQYVKVLHANQLLSPMSIACAPFDISTIELHLHHPEENAQALDLLRMVKTDGQLSLRGPYGNCTASRIQLDRPLIFLANGTGLAPIKAIMEELLQTKTLPSIHLYWYAEDKSELYLQSVVTEWLEQLSDFRYTPVLTRTVVQAVSHDYSDLSQHQLYIVDTVETTFAAMDAFMRSGLVKERFYSDVLDYDAHG